MDRSAERTGEIRTGLAIRRRSGCGRGGCSPQVAAEAAAAGQSPSRPDFFRLPPSVALRLLMNFQAFCSACTMQELSAVFCHGLPEE